MKKPKTKYDPLTWSGFTKLLPIDAPPLDDRTLYAECLEYSLIPWTDQAIDAIRAAIPDRRALADAIDPAIDRAAAASFKYLCHANACYPIAYHAITKYPRMPELGADHFKQRADRIRDLLVDIRKAYPDLTHPDGPGIHSAIADAAFAFDGMYSNISTIIDAAINNAERIRLVNPAKIDAAFDRMSVSFRHIAAELYQVQPTDPDPSPSTQPIQPGEWASKIVEAIDIERGQITIRGTIVKGKTDKPGTTIKVKWTPNRIAAIRALVETDAPDGWVDLTKIKCDGKKLNANAQSYFSVIENLSGYFQTRSGKCRINFPVGDPRRL